MDGPTECLSQILAAIRSLMARALHSGGRRVGVAHTHSLSLSGGLDLSLIRLSLSLSLSHTHTHTHTRTQTHSLRLALWAQVLRLPIPMSVLPGRPIVYLLDHNPGVISRPVTLLGGCLSFHSKRMGSSILAGRNHISMDEVFHLL